MFKATIYVTLKDSVLDPQGVAVKGSLHTLGFEGVRDVRIGKRVEVLLECESRAEAEKQIKELSEKVLSNPVIENFTFELEEVA
ncbi:phosphoribosylformylglycinamidine synthase subunit PurS [Laceyella sacchari]|jgi:phosphoribosylformylglycinamidine synthase PurS subunit|uniref:Phosphoribosylformylglycinamidine synthase subunit PurS n=3 Tax=Laceyella TaxID=292635 RepID=A0AA45WS60_9BACL|nr:MULTISPECIES: phosphoribosylformylglycinamidine synthase subunit PurS [Laceyella]KPC77127.1 phosphoribosylformylglycinamidine synthase [Thermoactinomyces vulgaris]AUS07731.1 phosphoribosylformylglycinamidine synthase subunit PurS [Laceyella sacchari]PRZ12187.1 phosphoribosylformylglycinamidine synthase [Laceyella sediminis]TCW36144.1 phosphoribosylformylglycinamidine synthase [Laceyella sacchari]UWE03961.1 phosphoribosylformylglycinamidine synthase subunit PurS [Laceyella sacchari]